MKTLHKIGSLTIAFAASMTIAAGQGYADNLTLSVTYNGTTLTCADGAACDGNPLAGAVSYTPGFPTVGTVTASAGGTGSGSPALAPLHMDLQYGLTQGSSAPAATVIIAVSENNLSATNQQWTATIGGTQETSAWSTAFAAFAGSGNTLFQNTNSICSAGPTNSSPGVSLSCSGPALPGFSGNPFSLTEQITLTAPAGSGTATGDAALNPGKIPEPASMLLFGFGLVGLGVWGRKRVSK